MISTCLERSAAVEAILSKIKAYEEAQEISEFEKIVNEFEIESFLSKIQQYEETKNDSELTKAINDIEAELFMNYDHSNRN